MAKWYVAAKKADFNGIGQRFSISPVLARVIRNRDIEGDEAIEKYLHGTIRDLYDPALLKGSREAVLLLKDKIKGQMPIRVIGDYDADGICSSYILKRGLEACGAVVDTMIPHRMKDGYGLNEHLVDEAYADGIDTILTCDNGIAAYAQIEQAKKYGMTVIVTDHHEIPYEEEPLAESDPETGERSRRRYKIPPADVVIDPKQQGDTYPFQEICGAVVAFKLMQLLFAEFGFDGISTDLTSGKRSLLDELLEFAAFATICDVMPLREENRILVRHGLELMKQTQNVGLHALMEVNQILPWQDGKLGAFHIGFVLGPCLNASGRLDSAQRAMELLDSKTREAAVAQAAFLKQLNDSRKEMTEEYVKIAVEMIESGPLKDDRVLVVFLPDCHESIAGIIAGRIRERYYRPTFVLTRGEEGVKGSARSIEGYHIYEEMTKCSSFFTKYGGHKMAAGLSMREEDVEPFRQKINEICTLTEDDLQEKIHIDVPMPVSYVSFRLVEELELLEPFGTGNSKPVFAQKDLKFVSARALGKAGNVLRFTVEDSEQKRWEMMYFGGKDNFEAYAAEKYGQAALDGLYSGKGSPLYFDVVYYPGVNTWQGNTKLQLVMQQYR
ncbi:DHH family phosphoesterase [Gallintestinimicrobium sp.]|uniref:single-stranded-DNA-specific exonuclease RecJ n=1 Tax=Gallintestinimicrobium sp. TaxID=2981655 RepID=UPI00307C20B9